MRTTTTPLGAITRGLAAGLLGNAVFTGYQALKSRAFEDGRDSSAEDRPPERWEDAPTPARVGRRFLAAVLDRDLPPERAPLVTEAVHWLYGTSWGAVYGVVHETFRPPAALHGLGLAVLVTAADYTVLPLMKLYKPAWEYPAKTLAVDLGNHAVYGLAVAGAYRLLERRRTRA